ncbi:MAG TPA: PIN domain-containing protein [Verrucomicrobiae bacterium]|nr:PIN domain-containing protein [Verrucomicrobiae bacterium]
MKMQELFPGYYRPTEAQFKELWENCIFVPDANVLLNIYGYSQSTREELLTLLERLSERVRMPFQFVHEYHRNRARAIMEQVRNYANAEKILKDLYDQELVPRHKHPFLEAKLLKAFNRIRDDLAASRKRHEALFKSDPFLDRITTLVKVVGPAPTPKELEQIHQTAQIRCDAKLPPGYADVKEKGVPAAYGDYIAWTQLMALSKAEKKPAILITDDAKEDWWQIQSDRTIGPRPELIAEFHSECGALFYMYSSDQFIKFAGLYLNQPVEEGAIEEIKQRFLDNLLQTFTLKPEQPPSGAASDKSLLASMPSEPENLKPESPSKPAADKEKAGP